MEDMSSIKFQLDNLDVELSHPNIELTKTKKGLAQFVCSNCGKKTLTIDRGDVENAGKHTTTDSKGNKHEVRGIFDSVKAGYEIAKERKEIEDEKSDFIEYFKRLLIWRRKNQGKIEHASNGAESGMPVTCSLCNTHYSLRVKITNPVNVDWEEEYVAVELVELAKYEADLILIFEKRRIKNNAANLNLLESICAGSIPYTEHAEEFLLRINQLNADVQKSAKFSGELKAPIDFESEYGQKLLTDLSLSLTDVGKAMEKSLKEQLTACLKSITEFASSPIPEE
jgi:hypothetical protein